MTSKRSDNPRLTPGTLLVSACGFADAADCYAMRAPGERNELVLTFLLTRALELALKSILRKNGKAEMEIRGHQVQKLFGMVLQAHPNPRLTLSRRRRAVLALLDAYAPGQFMVYSAQGLYRLPPTGVLRGIVHEVIRFAVNHVRGAGIHRRPLRGSERAARGMVVPTDGRYANVSRRRTFRAQIRQFEEIFEAL